MKKRNNSCAKTVLRTVLLIILAAVVGGNIYLINASRLAGDLVPMPFGVGAAVVRSGSMEPELSVGDLLFVVQQETYGVNDVVVFQDKNMAVTHRILSITQEKVITKGDANNTEDNPILPTQIRGRVVLAVPLLGYFVNMVKTPIGTFAVAILAIWLMECSFRSDKEKEGKQLDALKAEIERLKQAQEDA